MNTRTIILTVMILWLTGGIALRQKYIELRSYNKTISELIKSYEALFFAIIVLAGILMLQ